MLWQRIRRVLSPKTNREFTVNAAKVNALVKAAKKSETNILEQLAQLNLVLKHGRE